MSLFLFYKITQLHGKLLKNSCSQECFLSRPCLRVKTSLVEYSFYSFCSQEHLSCSIRYCIRQTRMSLHHHVHSLTAAGQCNCTLHKCTSYKSTGTVQRAVVVGWEQQRYSGMGENNSGRWVLLETGTNLGGIIFCTNLMTKCRRKTQIARRFHNFRSWAQSKLIGMSWRIERCERHWTTLWKRCYFQPNAQFIGTWWPPWILVQMERSGSLWGCLPTERVIK